MSHGVIMNQVTIERCHIFARAAMLKANFVVPPSIVYKRIDASERLQSLLDGF